MPADTLDRGSPAGDLDYSSQRVLDVGVSDERAVERVCLQPVRGIRRWAYWGLSAFFFALALVGVVLPGIPTTPFLLLMSYFLMRVSPGLHAKAMAWPLVGGPLRDWRDQGGVRLGVKILACCMVTVLVGSTLLWSNLPATLKLLIACVAIYGMSIVIRLPRARSR